MKHFFYLIILFLITACSNGKLLQLPEITKSDTNEVLDVSPAYIFYDETKPDSLELNRKNLISTTNWLVNVDKRLLLKQVIPTIMFLQEKKRDAKMHKNEAAKNYFSCNNTTIKNLGFIEFTDVFYHIDKNVEEYISKSEAAQNILIQVNSLDAILVTFSSQETNTEITTNKKELLKIITDNLLKNGKTVIFSSFNKELTFQDYIAYKSEIIQLESEHIINQNNEFIY